VRKKLSPGQRIRVYLIERDMRQGELAAQLGLSESRLSKILSGKYPVSLEEAFRIENTTGIPARDFARVA
jgi:transcriptional regulator with XRE-family HTH domain